MSTESELRRQWGEAIRARRLALALTQDVLAKRVGVEQPTVSDWETGSSAPTLANQIAIARVLACDPRDLFAFEAA